MNKESIFKIFFSGILLLLFSTGIHAQGIKATARLDTSSILIGDQVKLELQVTHPAKQKVTFPAWADSLSKIELLSLNKKDTLASTDASVITERQSFLITSFDSGHYVIPPFKFTVEGDTGNFSETEALLLSVYAPAVDTTQAIKEIKGPLDVPFSFKELLPYIGWGLLAIIVIGVLIGLYFRYKKQNKPGEEIIKIPSRPAHETALEALDELEKEKVWQSQENGVKLYHSRISDIVRIYIEDRYKIPAMELTTDEILNNFKRTSMDAELKEKLRQLLQLSDLVKFAKAQPLPNEHELSLRNAFDFITSTIPAVKPLKKEKEEESL